MKRLKGPELKLSELKVPPFVTDLYWDLRDRRLLPLVALVLVAIVAAPFLLGGGSDESAPSAPLEVATPDEPSGAEASTLTVVEAKPGLRNYRKRLARRKPTNPFKQRYTAPQIKDAQLNAQTSTSTTSTSSTSSTTTSSSRSTSSETTSTKTVESSPSNPPSSGADSGDHLTLFAFAIDIKITRIEGGGDGSRPKTKSNTKHGVLPPAPLPGEKAPVVTYMGVGEGAKKALLMVSNNVKSIYGDAKCVSGTDTCQLLEVEPGLPETFVYGANDVRYKINVLKIEPVPTGHS